MADSSEELIDDLPIVESVPAYANYEFYFQRVGSSKTCRVYISIESNDTVNSLNIGNLTVDNDNNHVIQDWSSSVSVSGLNSSSIYRLDATIYNVPINNNKVHITTANISVVLNDYGVYYMGDCNLDVSIS